MRILVFGTGKYYFNRKKYIKDEVVAFIDNNASDGETLEGKSVFHPWRYCSVDFDKILLMSAHKKEMKEQLLDLGVTEELIWTWDKYFATVNAGRIDLYIRDMEPSKTRILVFTESLGYNGGSLTAVYAAVSLKKRGYNVCLAGGAKNVNEDFLTEISQHGINVAIIYDTPNLLKEDIYWIKSFDIVLVNVFQMLKCACDISSVRPVLWWLHEPDFAYKSILERFPECCNSNMMGKLNIFAVSDVARECFKYYFPNVTCGIMTYGIPDECSAPLDKGPSEKCVFAIIGAVAYIKGQDVFLKAAELMIDEGFKNLEFWIIGYIGDDEYSKSIYFAASKKDNIKIWGNLNRKEMLKVFDELDVVVSTSREETMSIVLTEGMMHGKICISSDSTGISRYINDGENGFVFKNEDVYEVYEKMKWVFLHKNELSSIERKARATYEKYFSMEAFGGRLERKLIQTQKKYM